MSLQQFSDIFALLAVQLRFTDADEATIRGYFKALSDLEPELVAFAAQRFAQGASLNDQGEAWFPKAPEWRAMAAKVQKERTDALDAVIRKLRIAGASPLCNDCDDTGWSMRDRTYARRCGCRELRRLEVLGRRPMPLLPEANVEGDATHAPTVLAMATRVASTKGMR